MGRTVKRTWLAGGLGGLLLLGVAGVAGGEEKFKYQYEFGSIRIPRADAGEPKRREVSVQRALDYLDQGATAWSRGRKCVTCHTNGSYMALRPSLSRPLGEPSREVRDFFGTVLREGRAQLGEESKLGDSQLIYVARGLAEWDAHVSGALSAETQQALKQLFERQLPTGEWKASQCWPSAGVERLSGSYGSGPGGGDGSGLVVRADRRGAEGRGEAAAGLSPPGRAAARLRAGGAPVGLNQVGRIAGRGREGPDHRDDLEQAAGRRGMVAARLCPARAVGRREPGREAQGREGVRRPPQRRPPDGAGPHRAAGGRSQCPGPQDPKGCPVAAGQPAPVRPLVDPLLEHRHTTTSSPSAAPSIPWSPSTSATRCHSTAAPREGPRRGHFSRGDCTGPIHARPGGAGGGGSVGRESMRAGRPRSQAKADAVGGWRPGARGSIFFMIH